MPSCAALGGGGDTPTGTQQVVSKLLVSNTIAGSVIGKAGANIENLQKSSGARIQLSRTGEFYPGVCMFCNRETYVSIEGRSGCCTESESFLHYRYVRPRPPPVRLTALRADGHLPHSGEDHSRQQRHGWASGSWWPQQQRQWKRGRRASEFTGVTSREGI